MTRHDTALDDRLVGWSEQATKQLCQYLQTSFRNSEWHIGYQSATNRYLANVHNCAGNLFRQQEKKRDLSIDPNPNSIDLVRLLLRRAL